MASTNDNRQRVTKNSSNRKKTKTSSSKTSSSSMRREVKIFIAGFISLVAVLSYYTSVFGVFGEIVKNIGLAFFGYPGFVIPVVGAIMLMQYSIKDNIKSFSKLYICSVSVMVLTSMFLTIEAAYSDPYLPPTFFKKIGALIEGGISCSDGGIIGALGLPLKSFFGVLGSKLILVFAIILLISVITRFVPIIWFVNMMKKLISIATEKYEDSAEKRNEKKEAALSVEKEAEKKSKKKAEKEDKVYEQVEIDFGSLPATAEKERVRVKKTLPEEKKEKAKENHSNAFDFNIFIPDEPSFPSEEPESSSTSEPVSVTLPKETVEEEIVPPVVEKKEPNVAIEISKDEFIVETKPYEFPPLSLLERNTQTNANTRSADLREQAKTLIETLRSFGVDAKILEVNKGPNVTRFELQPATGVKVSKIVGLADDIALNLAALSVRIEAPIPGKAAVGIEIPNSGGSMVRLREVIDSDQFKNFPANTAFALGKDITGTPIVTDISKMPHVLIAGATGSGKSVCINALITSILYKSEPKDVRFIMIDPKVVELSVYNGIPHLLIPVVTDPRKAAGALNWAVQEMTKRYKMFADTNVRDIKGYNEYAKLNGEKTLEQIIIIVDELADLMMVAPRDVEDAICRLAQMARAAGMHLVIATQRPSVDVITGLIKANVPSRIAFAVSSQIDSRTILDMGGAEKLLGKGDMLFLPMGASKPTRIQGAFISDKEVEKIVEFVKSDDVKYDEDVLEKIESGASGEKDSDGGDADELLPQAIEIVVEAGQASASLLQRRLKVGYSRAGRLIDQLEARGIVGPHEGAKPRSVLISRSEYAEMTMQM